MDTGKGYFEKLTEESEEKLEQAKRALEAIHPNHGGWFKEGEEVELKGSLFRVKRVKPTELVLKLLERSS